jgi:uncharacterized cupredoxin-like copper-binding protein
MRFSIVMVLALGVLAAGCSRAPRVVVEAKEFRFNPSQISLEAGKPVRLVLQNKGSVEHDLQILGLKVTGGGHGGHGGQGAEATVHIHALPGKEAAVEFTPAEKGEFRLVCQVAGHEESGMVGSLVVR